MLLISTTFSSPFLGVLIRSSTFWSPSNTYLSEDPSKSLYSINCKVNLLEHKIITIKEKISDLEIFKAKVYNNEVIPGRRVWDEIDIDEDEDFEID